MTDSDPTAEARAETEPNRIQFEVETTIPTVHGDFHVRAYTDAAHDTSHVMLWAGELRDGMLVRVHSECLTGEAFGSLKCECGPQLEAALDAVQREGGAVLYLRGQEGRGIGLVNKLKAYRLQEDGLDTVDANLALGLPADAREYSAAVQMLEDVGVSAVRLLTNNPLKSEALEEHGIHVLERVPLEVGRNAVNDGYLRVKAERMGHLLSDGAGLSDGEYLSDGDARWARVEVVDGGLIDEAGGEAEGR